MPTRAGFQSVAKNLINNTFGDFKKPLTFHVESYDYDTGTTSTDEVVEGIRLSLSKADLALDGIQMDDYRIIVEKQRVKTDVRADKVSMTFDGVKMDIVTVVDDPADATYTIIGRAK